jgi:hypothetical protein
MPNCSIHFVHKSCQHLPCGIAAAALVLWFAMAGGNAAAESCGHYVKRMGPGFVPGKTDVATHQPATEVPCGCTGAHCGRAPQPIAPQSPGNPLRLHKVQDVVACAAGSELDPLNRGWYVADSSLRVSRGYMSRLDRPPRG